jgi:uncharacterized protein (DUF1015 family)
MPQIAGFRGALWDATKVDLAKVAATPVERPAEKLGRGELVRDPTRALYRYHQTFVVAGRKQTRKTVIAALRLTPWSEGVVRPHEATDAGALEKATRGIAADGIHTDPVFAGYRDAAGELDRLMRSIEDGRPAIDVTTADDTQHRVWRVQSAEIIGKVRPLFAPKKLHILDGHARYEGMLAYREQLNSQRELLQYSSGNYGLACLVNVADPALVLAPRHRIVRGKDLDRTGVLERAKAFFIIDKIAGAAKDPAKQKAALADTVAHQPAFVLIFANDPDAWKLTLSPDVTPTSAGAQVHRALQKYEPVVVEHLLLARVLGGAKATQELDIEAVVARVAAGADIGIVLRPMSVEQVLHADELGQVLPFGSTWFPPALARLVTMPIDPDEDLI